MAKLSLLVGELFSLVNDTNKTHHVRPYSYYRWIAVVLCSMRSQSVVEVIRG